MELLGRGWWGVCLSKVRGWVGRVGRGVLGRELG
jgi:hypothetical protein